MQIEQLQNMTVLQLRKLAKDHNIKLSAGIDKAGIIERVYQELQNDNAAMKEAVTSAGQPSVTEGVGITRLQAENPQVPLSGTESFAQQNVYPGASPFKPYTSFPQSADVTAVSQYQQNRWNYPVNTADAYRQSWTPTPPVGMDSHQNNSWQQARTATPSRFGPRTRPDLPDDLSSSSATNLQASTQNSYYTRESRSPEQEVQKADGYRLGYRAAPQQRPYNNSRSDYSRDSGYGRQMYQQPSRDYRPSGYNPAGVSQGNVGRGYSAPRYSPTVPSPHYPAETVESDNIYQARQDFRFIQQQEAGSLPDLMQLLPTSVVTGVIDVSTEGTCSLLPQNTTDDDNRILVSAGQVRRFGLRSGDLVNGVFRLPQGVEKSPVLLTVEKVNGKAASEVIHRHTFEQMTPIYPDHRIVLETGTQGQMVMRLLDIVAPIGFGQRAMIIAPPESGSLTVLKDMSRAIHANDPQAVIMMLLIDLAPEEVTDMQDHSAAEVFATTFTETPETQTRKADAMLEKAQSLVESGNNVVILLDSLTKLTRAYQAAISQGNRPITNSVTPASVTRAKRFFGAARNTREGGSLTVIATINYATDSRVDEAIFEEFRNTASTEIVLCKPQADDPVFPMVNLQKSGTKKESLLLLLNNKQIEGLKSIRRILSTATNADAVLQLVEMMKKTKSNEDLLGRLQDWIILWEKSGYLKK